jgi:hypothetical protein
MMPKFRKKPVEIEAVQLLWTNWHEMCEFADVGKLSEGHPEGCYIDANGNASEVPVGERHVIGLQIPTLEGVMLAREGDWIIRGVKGELYPCKADIFEATYEPVDRVKTQFTTVDEYGGGYTENIRYSGDTR